MLATLEAGLTDQWNDQLKEAWSSAYGILAEAMIEAQQESLAKRA